MLNEITCPICLRTFTTHRNPETIHYCKFCRENRSWDIKQFQRKMKAMRDREKKVPKESITAVLREIEEYNKSHGTHLTYGQYMYKKTCGVLPE